MAHCASGRSCVWWVERYLKDCVCGVRDDVSICLGFISIFSWAVSDIPQIFTNCKSGSTEGISLAFLMTCVVGDIFDLVGCLLQSTTLPTQFYMALLDTISTVVLLLQTLYYDHICKWWKAEKGNSSPMKRQEDYASKDLFEHTKPLNLLGSMVYSTDLAKQSDADFIEISNGAPASSLPIPTISPGHLTSIARNLYNIFSRFSRSLASSHTPTPSSYLAASSPGSGQRCPSFTLNHSLVNDEGLLTNMDPTPKKSKTALRSVAETVFFVGGLNYFHLQAIPTFDCFKIDSRASVLTTGRKILQEVSTVTFSWKSLISEQSTGQVGTCLGWLMAAIYMGGSLRQIFHIVQRGTVEGLNPLMFMFAVIGNATYVGSIIVRTLEWKKLKPNLPWLVDAAVCVLLNCFILAQFIYYKTRKTQGGDAVNNGYYEAIDP